MCSSYPEPTTNKTDGKGRSTVQEVYTQISSDIAKAVEYLKASDGTTSIKKDKSFVGLYAALGIQARVALTMEDWATAATAAVRVINSGQYEIQNIKAADFVEDAPNFINTVSNKNVISGCNYYRRSDRCLCFFSSHIWMQLLENMALLLVSR